MKKRLEIILFTLFLASILFISVNASITNGNKSHEITTTYGPGNTLQGWVNISLKNVSVNSLFTDSQKNSISLLKALQLNSLSLQEGEDYNCTVSGCGDSLMLLTPELSKTFSLPSKGEKFLGFELKGEDIGITKVEFNISSTAGPSCTNQFDIDFFLDENTDYKNSNLIDEGCGANYRTFGCFNESKATSTAKIMTGKGSDGKMYCQKIRLDEGPGFKLGAFMNVGNGAKETNISLYDSEMNKKAGCSLGNASTNGFAEKSCSAKYAVSILGDYYVCVHNNYGADENTKIWGYSDSTTGCGFYTTDGEKKAEEYAYKIFAEQMKFGAIGDIDTSSIFGNILKNGFQGFIDDKYDGNCKDGCVIPIFFGSNYDLAQNIEIKNIKIGYSSKGGEETIDKIYELGVAYSNVTSKGAIKISLDNFGFTLPSKYGNQTYSLKLGDNTIFSDKILIEKVPEIKYLLPSYGFDQILISFSADVSKVNNASITSYSWDFGDGTSGTSTINVVTHKYTAEGIFPIKVTVKDSDGRTSSRVFSFEVKSYLLYFYDRSSIMEENLENIGTQISNFSIFFQQGIKKVIDPALKQQQLNTIKNLYNRGDYESAINQFLILEASVPESIFERINTGSLSFYPDKNIIEAGIAKEVNGGEYDTTQKSAYEDAIYNWGLENLNMKVKYHQIAGDYAGRSGSILNVFEMDITNLGTETGTIFIKQLANMTFDKSYGEQIKSGYFYIPLTGTQKTITFYTTEDVDFSELPLFVSPAINQLVLIEDYGEAEKAGMRWGLFFMVIFLLIATGLIAYLVLQGWYKYKYENYLFKNRNYLYNLIHYINAQKTKGVRDDQIFRDLKKEGWTSEQINYVIRKYLGKRTGMIELPTGWIFSLFRKKEAHYAGIPNAPPINSPYQKFEQE